MALRRHFNLQSACWGDFEDLLLWCCCWGPALCQEHRTLKYHRVEDGVWPEEGEAAPLLPAGGAEAGGLVGGAGGGAGGGGLPARGQLVIPSTREGRVREGVRPGGEVRAFLRPRPAARFNPLSCCFV